MASFSVLRRSQYCRKQVGVCVEWDVPGLKQTRVGRQTDYIRSRPKDSGGWILFWQTALAQLATWWWLLLHNRRTVLRLPTGLPGTKVLNRKMPVTT